MNRPADQKALLRVEVARLRARERRRVFDVTVNVGLVAGKRESLAVPASDLPALDASLRTDLVARLVSLTPAVAASAWLTRPGVPHGHTLDLEWLSAALLAFGMHERRLVSFYAVTRSGWLDVRSGEARTWKRLRL